MARAISKVAPDWWDYTTLDSEILQDAAKLTPDALLKLSRPGFKVIFYETLEDFYLAEALEYIEAWKQSTADNPAGLCGPIGPTEQLPLVARLVNALDLDVRDAHFWGMDEWVENGEPVPVTHPLSFARADKFTVECDEPEGIGGTDQAPTPTQLLLASLAHCQAITLRIYAEAMDIAIDNLNVKVTGTLDLRRYFSVDVGDGPKAMASLQEIVIRTEIVTHETEARVRELLKASKGRGICLSSVEKGVNIQYRYRLNGHPFRLR